MDIGELISTTREILADVVSASNPNELDALVSKDLLVNYLSEGEEIFCEETGFFRSKSVSAICDITTIANQASYTIDSRILQVYAVRANNIPLTPVSGLTTNLSATGTTLTGYSLDEGERLLTLFPTPTTVQTVTLTVWHKPVKSIAEKAVRESAVPDIASRYHIGLCHYAAHKVFLHNDEELLNPNAASTQLAIFRTYLASGKREFNRLVLQIPDNIEGVGAAGWSW